MQGATVLVDVSAVGLGAELDHFCPQFFKDHGPDVIARPIGAIHHHLQALKGARTHRPLGKLDVASHRVVHPDRLANLGPFARTIQRLIAQELLHFGLHGVAQLVSVGPEDLDSIVAVGIVRGSQHDPCITRHRLCQVGHRRGGNRTGQENARPLGHQPAGQGGFQHVAGDAGILSDHHLVPTPALRDQHACNGPSQSQGNLRRDRVFVGHSPDPVRSKQSLRHSMPCYFTTHPSRHDLRDNNSAGPLRMIACSSRV